MRCVHVEIKGADGQIHGLTLQASSLYDGAAKAMEEWARLWWFNPQAVLEVKCGDERWRVRQDAVRRWREREK